MNEILWLEKGDLNTPFPSAFDEYDEPNGLLAIGGDLSVERLLMAYRSGIFPWFEEDQPILWWSPDPRAVLYPDQLKISRSLRKTLRRQDFNITINQDFSDVIKACAAPRSYSDDTWITTDMQKAYLELHRLGHAHSIEVRDLEGKLIAGLYGLLLEKVFCGESMFHLKTDMSKVAMVALGEWLQEKNIGLIDCQIPNDHLSSLGAVTMPKQEFLQQYLGLDPE